MQAWKWIRRSTVRLLPAGARLRLAFSLPGRHFIFSIPKVLRHYFLYDRERPADPSRRARDAPKVFCATPGTMNAPVTRITWPRGAVTDAIREALFPRSPRRHLRSKKRRRNRSRLIFPLNRFAHSFHEIGDGGVHPHPRCEHGDPDGVLHKFRLRRA